MVLEDGLRVGLVAALGALDLLAVVALLVHVLHVEVEIRLLRRLVRTDLAPELACWWAQNLAG